MRGSGTKMETSVSRADASNIEQVSQIYKMPMPRIDPNPTIRTEVAVKPEVKPEPVVIKTE